MVWTKERRDAYSGYWNRLRGKKLAKNTREEIFKKEGWRIIFFDETKLNEKSVLDRLGV